MHLQEVDGVLARTSSLYAKLEIKPPNSERAVSLMLIELPLLFLIEIRNPFYANSAEQNLVASEL